MIKKTINSNFKDKINDWYKVANGNGMNNKIKEDKNFKNHLIKPCQMISIIGPTGSGKSTALLEFILNRKTNSFYRIIIFSGSTTDEPLYNLLKKISEDIELIQDADKLPELSEMNGQDKNEEKLIIFDDIINLSKKELLKIQKWFNSARKYGFTCISMAQNYQQLPIQIRRNTMIYFLFRMNDNNTINNILKTHNCTEYPKEVIKKMYLESTKNKKDFFIIDFNSDDKYMFRHNFTDILDPKLF